MWRVHPADPARAASLAAALDLHPLTAQLLVHRGLSSPTEAAKFLRPTLQTLDDPTQLPELPRAITRLKRAVSKREPIVIFGDSDVDGLTASVILYEVIQQLGGIVSAIQSNRITGGYGIPETVIEQLCRSSAKLVCLVDCGTNQPEAVRRLAAAGIDTIILDHHVPLPAPPVGGAQAGLDGWAKPHALVNPHRDAQSKYRQLCSAALAFKVAQALAPDEEQLARYLDLAALGSLADYSALTGDSRVIVAEGLRRIVRSERPGLQQLCEATKTATPDPEHILRRLVPRLNASGRLGDSAAVWNLLRRDEDGATERWMEQTEVAHTKTKELHRRIVAQAQEQVNRLHFKDQYVMVVSGNGWHQGLMGPLASQLARQYGRPAIALAMDGAHGTGSGRSIPLFNLLDALQACQGLLVRFGGHAQACGLTLQRSNLEPFQTLLNQEIGRTLGTNGLMKTRTIDLEMELKAIQPRWVRELAQLAPFGQGNLRPTVLVRGVRIDVRSPRSATLSTGHMQLPGKGGFSTLDSGERYDVIATPEMDGEDVVLTVSDVRGAAAPSGRGRI